MSLKKVVPRLLGFPAVASAKSAARTAAPNSYARPRRGARGRLHKAEGVRRLGGVLPRDPSAGLSRFRSLRCSRFRHCGSPGPWSLRPRPKLFPSACQFSASPESILLSPASSPFPFSSSPLESPGRHCPAAPVTGGDHTPRQRHGPDSANSFSGASPGACGLGC